VLDFRLGRHVPRQGLLQVKQLKQNSERVSKDKVERCCY